MICATSCVVPPTGSALVAAVSVMVDPDGASSGTFWQETVKAAAVTRATTSERPPRSLAAWDTGISGNMKDLTIIISMKLRGQAGRAHGGGAPCAGDDGYAMAALLVAMSILAVMMTVALPVWKQNAQREKEE